MSVRLAQTWPASCGGTAATAPTVVTAPPPRRLGRYTLQGTIGEGAMGLVYRAHDPQLDRVVALKTIRKSMLGSAEASVAAAVRLRNEAQAAARLSHPGIVSVYEYGEDGDETYIAMEFVQGTPLLAGLTHPQGLPIDDVLYLMVQLLAALQCAHDLGVWHRDIKPANLMITPGGRLKIADFGIARIDAVALTHDASVMGSPGYMAPECYRGEAIDQRTDLYACGVLLYELLTGLRPFRGSPEIVMYRTLHLPTPPLAQPDAPQFRALASFEHVVQRAMAKAPADRYASALAMRRALTLAAAREVPNTLSAAAMALLAPPGPSAAPAIARLRSSPPPQPLVRDPPPPPRAHEPTDAPMPTVDRFTREVTDRLAAELADELGPVARCVVQRAAACSDSVAALVMRVAHEALPAARRQAFIEHAHAALAQAAPPGIDAPARRVPPDGADVPMLGDTPLDDALLEGARAVLARGIGPVAGWMVKRAAAGAGTREQFITRLAALAAEGRDRDRLLAALCRLP